MRNEHFLRRGRNTVIVVRRACAAIIIFMLALSSGCAKHPSDETPGQARREERKVVVATVNGAPITKYTLVNLTNRMTEANQSTSKPEAPEVTSRKALDHLIFRELAYQEAVRAGIHADDEQVDKAMERFITTTGHEEGYKDYLAREDLTPADVRAEMERGLTIQLIVFAEVVRKVTVTDDEARKEYERRKSEFRTPEQRVVSEVVFSPVKEDTVRKAEEVRRTVTAGKGKSFKALVSDGTFTIRTGVVEKEKEPEIYDAVLKLKEGELSDVIRTSQGVYVVRLDSIVPEKQASFEDVERRIKQQLVAEGQAKRFQDWEQELKKNAVIEILDPSLRK
jgi:parvulin-like peptidyl-prolyl isomerase